MTFNNYQNFTPIFYSEVSSSYMLYDVLKENSSITAQIVSSIIGKIPEGDCSVYREKSLGDVGKIDLFIDARISGRETSILVECKIHDYISVTQNQISRYYNKAIELYPGKDVYFIYLTQFTNDSISDISDLSKPPTIDEFRRAKQTISHRDRLFHVSWMDVHKVIQNASDKLNPELTHIVNLHKEWVKKKSNQEIQNQRAETGTRDIASYLPDINIDLPEQLPFGNLQSKSSRAILEIGLRERTGKELNDVLVVIKTLADSKELVPFSSPATIDSTKEAVQKFLSDLIASNEWNMASFYTSVFALTENTDLLRLNGTGTRGFSVSANVKNKGPISLCTLWVIKHTLEFGLRR